MAEPDDVMSGPLWPPDWKTGWVTWRYANVVGQPLEGSIRMSLSVRRAVSTAFHTTVLGGSIEIPLVDGKPSGDFVVINGAGVPCIEVPIGNDPDIMPDPIQLIIEERFTAGNGSTLRRMVTAANTLNDPLWISGDLSSLTAQPGVVAQLVWKVPTEAQGIPGDAEVGDLVWYLDTSRITEVTSV